jgi:hypothetical protein
MIPTLALVHVRYKLVAGDLLGARELLVRYSQDRPASVTTKAAGTITLRSGGRQRSASLDPIIARTREQLQALVDEHVPAVKAANNPSVLHLSDKARAVLLAAITQAMRAGYDDSGADPVDWDDDEASTYAEQRSDWVSHLVAGLAAGLLAGSISAAMADARMGLTANGLITSYERGFFTGVQSQGTVQQSIWHATQDKDTCDLCSERDGTVYPGDPPYWPGDGDFGDAAIVCRGSVNCFAPGTLVSGRFVSGMHSRYRGEMVELRTRSGRYLSVTPNHPIATPAGFVPANRLRKGDHVLTQAGDVDEAASVDAQDRPATVEQVLELLDRRADAWSGSFHPRREDLHGDAIGVEGDIYVVGTDRHLLHDGEPVSAEGLRQLRLVAPDSQNKSLDGSSAMLDLLGRDPGGASGLPGRAEQAIATLSVGRPASTHSLAAATDRNALTSQDRIDGRAVHVIGLRERLPGYPREVTMNDLGGWQVIAEAVPVSPCAPTTIGTVAKLDACLSQPAGHDVGVDAAFLRDLEGRHSGTVARDEVVEIRRGWMDGHVYDLGTDAGWLVAGGIIVANCRCEVEYEIVPADDGSADEEPRAG